jgi:hypothetical protein
MHTLPLKHTLSRLLSRTNQQPLLLRIMRPPACKRLAAVLRLESLYPRLQLGPEMPNQSLQGPRKRLAERANRVSLDLLGKLLEHINFALAGLALLEAVHDLVRPLAALATWRALTAGLMVVELREARDGAHDVSRLVHDNDGGGTETRLRVLERVEIHKLVVADMLGEDGRRGAAGDDSLEVVPAADDAAAVLVDELAEGDRHFFLDGAGVVDVARDGKELGALVALATKAGKPAAAAAEDGGGDGDGLDVGDGRRASEETDGSGERRLQAGLSGLAFERLDERRLLAADVGAHAAVDVDVKVVAGAAGVLADEAGLVRLLDGALEDGGLVEELAADVDVGGGGVHGAASNEAALDELVGVLAHNLTVLAGAGLALVGVDDEVAGLVVLVPVLEVHERLREISTSPAVWIVVVVHTHFRPEGKPAPPRPRRPEALISEMICRSQPSPICQHQRRIPSRGP